jgi:valyl-tRNA synthetase
MAEDKKDALNEQYDFREAEKRILGFWLKEKIFKFDPKNKNVFSVDNPPPTVSGKMHIGHAFQYSQMDFIARFKRMNGYGVFYPFGTDDNGLPTERLVEKMKNVKSKNMSRSDFIELCLKTLEEITPDFIQDWKSIGISSDYEKYYSTIDKNSQRISQKSFLDLYKKGEAYKKDFPSLWCCECQTAIAQAELEDKELPSLFSTLKFSCQGKDLLIATTRPELLGACVAVFINPKDKRYSKLIGKEAKVPIFGFTVPIIADESADIDKGTGILMICSYGDKYDAEAIARHKLKPRIILNKEGKINSGQYAGLKIKEARKKILEDLKNSNLITEQKNINHIVNVHDKCGTEIEILPTEQWFVKILDKKKELLEQGQKVKWHPEFMFKRYENWVKGLEWDWNISRERHFGIPIPIWFCSKCNKTIIAEEKELPVDPVKIKKKCSCGEIASPETKVFDTWQTSSMTPQIIMQMENLKIPCSLRCNAHDIIRTWDFYTIVKSFLHEKKIPWTDLMVSGFVTLSGEKMSKSKGNVVDPRIVLDNYGADCLRYWAAGSKLGEDLDYQEKDLVTGKKFVTKLWNASKFLFMNIGDYKNSKPKKLHKTDEIFLNELNRIVESSTNSFSEYEYSKVKLDVESFFWKNFCDNYMEIVKNRIYNGSDEEKESAKYTLYNSLLSILKIMAPITPFITEEIYQKFFRKNEKTLSIHISDWPSLIKFDFDKADEKIWNKFIEILEIVRKTKSENKKSMKAEIVLTLPKEDQQILIDCLEDLKTVTCSKQIKIDNNLRIDFI